MFDSYLKENGWYEGRKVDVTSYVNYFKENNIRPSSYALDILEEFGGIEIKIPAEISGLDFFTELVVDPKRGSIMLDEVIEFEEAIGEKLTAIGFFPRSDLDILVSESGDIYFAGNAEFMYISRLDKNFVKAVSYYFNNEYLDSNKFPNLYPEE